MDVLAGKVIEMENLHTAQLRNMTHGRDPAEGLGAKACSILISALTSKKLRSLDISSNMLGAAAGEIWGPLLTSQPYVEELIFEADHRFRHGYKGDACNDLLKNFEPKNLKKLVVDIRSRSTLNEFLDEVSLLTDVSNESEGTEKISIMTLHSAKGLEFDYVFLPGWEEGIFPNQRSLDENLSLIHISEPTRPY